MFGTLLLLFVMIPLVDLILLLQIGQVLHFWPTLALVILTGVVGAALARRQGMQTLARIQDELSNGRMPGRQLADGALIILAGALLLTPGFLTDLAGIALLIPPIRSLCRVGLSRWFSRRIKVETIIGPTGANGSPFSGSRPVRHVENAAIRES
jgi:UPF0716 protein FxsA